MTPRPTEWSHFKEALIRIKKNYMQKGRNRIKGSKGEYKQVKGRRCRFGITKFAPNALSRIDSNATNRSIT